MAGWSCEKYVQCSGVSVPNWKYVIDININMNVVNMSHVHEVWHEGLSAFMGNCKSRHNAYTFNGCWYQHTK